MPVERIDNGLMLPSSNALRNTLSCLALFPCLSPTVFWALSASLSPAICSVLPGMGSFYCLKGTLLTTHICPFIILHGPFYSRPSTVASADQCLAKLKRSKRASAGQWMHGGVRERERERERLTPARLVIARYVEEGERKEWRRTGAE